MDSKATTGAAVRALTALAQETRLAVFRLLVERGPAGLTAGRIAEKLDLPGATLSFHLKELSGAGLVTPRQEGRFIHYSADFRTMNGLVAYLTENCCRDSRGCEAACGPESIPRSALRRAPPGARARANATKRKSA